MAKSSFEYTQLELKHNFTRIIKKKLLQFGVSDLFFQKLS